MEENHLFQENYFAKIASVYLDRNGKNYQLVDLIIYNKSGIILKTGAFVCDDIEKIKFKNPIFLKNSENFEIKCNYIIKNKALSFKEDKRYNLYIYEDNIDYKYIGKVKKRNVYI